MLLSTAVSAQRNTGSVRSRAAITRCERFQLRQDLIRYRILQRHTEREGITTLLEVRRLSKMKRKNSRAALRARYKDR